MTASNALEESDVAMGRPSRRRAFVSSSRPPSMASSRRSRWNHWRILDFAREDWAREEARAGVPGSPYVSRERGGSGECVLAVRGLQGAGLAPQGTGPP